MGSIKENINEIRKEIEKAAAGAGRPAAEISLIAVSKTVDEESIKEAAACGIAIFGENKVQEAKSKITAFGVIPSKLHMIGHLQTNKAKDAVKIFDMIQSVDSLKLAVEIDKEAKKAGKTMEVLVEVNIGSEISKFGVNPDDAVKLLAEAGKLENIRIKGLMAVAPFLEDAEKVRPFFKRMKKLFEEIKGKNIPNVEMKHLSMGMSADYKVAIEEGSTMVRIGTAIFGSRK